LKKKGEKCNFTFLKKDYIRSKKRRRVHMILDKEILEKFSNEFQKYLNNYKLSYYLRSSKNAFSKENIIHSTIIRIRFCVEYINKSKLWDKKSEYIELYTMVSII